MIAYVLTWLLLPGRLNEDKMSTEDVFLLNAIKTRIPTNWVAVLKHHMIVAGDDYAHKLPYGVFISKVLELQGVDASEEERRIVCKRSKEIGIPILSSIGLKMTVNGWFFNDEQIVGSRPTLDQDHTKDSDDEDSMAYTLDSIKIMVLGGYERSKEKVARVTRNAIPCGWISDEEIRGKLLYWRVIKYVVPHKYLALQLFKKEGFLFQEWIAYQRLTDLVKMNGDCYPDLVEVFYTNLRVVNGVIHSRVKGVNITVDDNVWLDIAGLKAEGLDSHIRNSESNRWLTKRAIYINFLRYPRRYRVDKQYLHDGLNKEEKIIAYVPTSLLLLGRYVEDIISIEDVFLLNAIKTRIPTNWVAVLKDHMIAVGDKYAHQLPSSAFISQVLILQGVDVSQEVRLVCNKSQEIGILSLFSIGLERTVNGWFFRDEKTFGSTPTLAADHTAFIPQTDFEKYVVDQFRKKSERDERVEDTLLRWEKKGNKNCIGFETKDSDDESTYED
ncbi:hypothetical protein LR48_Vigan09g053300 [Vigna angularis]|uniref:Putative plant transposon protein domain-containing protein n=1 Tax=Phaseolus angularis TaxID=3914 RepID=A0A0L9VB45_PHAAN|nr:hypothetical protein LR48_Vigan09g053300 [Vigna angularis]